MKHPISGIYTGEKTLHVVAVASDGDLKRWEDFYRKRKIQIACVNQRLSSIYTGVKTINTCCWGL